MNPTTSQRRLFFSAFSAFLSCWVTIADAAPDAQEILSASRMNQVSQSARLAAELRDSDGKRTPFVIALDGGVIDYDFESGPDISLRLFENSAELTERSRGSRSEVSPAKQDQRVMDTPITYEDLALQFLYWPRAKVNGEEKIYGRQCWELEIQAPRGRSQYGVVRVWVDKETGAIMQMRGYNDDGKPIKHFKVTSAQKLDGQWMLKEMRVEALSPKSGKPVERAYLVVKDKL
ncbi:MAG: outer membrane lipoprotein-sorting protein [Chthoniobacterales bacterium]